MYEADGSLSTVKLLWAVDSRSDNACVRGRCSGKHLANAGIMLWLCLGAPKLLNVGMRVSACLLRSSSSKLECMTIVTYQPHSCGHLPCGTCFRWPCAPPLHPSPANNSATRTGRNLLEHTNRNTILIYTMRQNFLACAPSRCKDLTRQAHGSLPLTALLR